MKISFEGQYCFINISLGEKKTGWLESNVTLKLLRGPGPGSCASQRYDGLPKAVLCIDPWTPNPCPTHSHKQRPRPFDLGVFGPHALSLISPSCRLRTDCAGQLQHRVCMHDAHCSSSKIYTSAMLLNGSPEVKYCKSPVTKQPSLWLLQTSGVLQLSILRCTLATLSPLQYRHKKEKEKTIRALRGYKRMWNIVLPSIV